MPITTAARNLISQMVVGTHSTNAYYGSTGAVLWVSTSCTAHATSQTHLQGLTLTCHNSTMEATYPLSRRTSSSSAASSARRGEHRLERDRADERDEHGHGHDALPARVGFRDEDLHTDVAADQLCLDHDVVVRTR